MDTNKVIQHGEVMLVPLPVSSALKGKIEAHKQYIVAHSETGHHHTLKSEKKFNVIFNELETYLSLESDAELVHEKSFDFHPTKTVKKGKYMVIYKSEYNPAKKIVEKVRD